MKKLIWIILIGLLFGFFYGSWFYFFRYPENVTDAAFESVKIGDNVISLFANGHDYLKGLQKNRGNSYLTFSSTDKTKSCLSLRLSTKDAYISKDSDGTSTRLWNGTYKNLDAILEEFKNEIAKCEKICATFMPTLFYRGTFCTVYDKNLKIISKDLPWFWD